MRLIDAERLRALISTMYEPFPDICNVNVVLTAIDKAPTIEAEPVRHGRWIEESANEYYCSYCGKYAPIVKNMRHCDCSKWCKECGTKMDGGADNG